MLNRYNVNNNNNNNNMRKDGPGVVIFLTHTPDNSKFVC